MAEVAFYRACLDRVRQEVSELQMGRSGFFSFKLERVEELLIPALQLVELDHGLGFHHVAQLRIA